MLLMIGCPVLARDWILPFWFEAIERQDFPLEDVGFIFEVAPNDEPTLQALLDFSHAHPELRCFDIFVNTTESHAVQPTEIRTWDWHKYMTMVNLRNDLLSRVVCHNPDRFFSLDSDILLENPRTLTELVRLTEDHDAVSPLMYMTPTGTEFPSVMTFNEIGIGFRDNDHYSIGELFQADVIMAAVMMGRSVYQQARYHWHRQGEDLGWAQDCAAKGFKLWAASYLYCPHIMSPNMLENYRKYGDPRSPFNALVQ